ncbi:MAG: hypothetical protein DSZ03_07685, partial [Sulfurimonas sp.]
MSKRANPTILWLSSFLLLLSSTLFGASQYEEQVKIPKYNPKNPTHVLITPSNGKWTKSILNNPNHKHFYMRPGNYLNKTIWITSSGT